MTVRSYAGAAKRTTLSAGISNSALSFTVTAGGGTGYPTGADGPFTVLLDHDTAGEEKLLCSGRTGDTFTVQAGGRGYDDTIASTHSLNAPVDHVGTAIDFREANAHVNDTTGDPHPQYLTPAEGNAAYPLRSESGAAAIGTSETTTSTSATDLTTLGPTVPVTIGPSGRALVLIGASLSNSLAGSFSIMTFAVSGATARAADINEGLLWTPGQAGNYAGFSHAVFVTGLTPGVNTFTAKYAVSGGIGAFGFRRITVIPL